MPKSLTVMQEEIAKDKAMTAAREKKAAKKARRKEREAALRAADQPQFAAPAASAAANGPDDPQTSTDADNPAAAVAASTHASATAAQAGDASLGRSKDGDCTADGGPAAVPEVSESTPVEFAARAAASSAGAALAVAPADVECLLSSSQGTSLGGDGDDPQNTEDAFEAAADGSLKQAHQASHEGTDETDADADGTLGPQGDRTDHTRLEVGKGGDDLGKLLGDLGVSETDGANAQPHDTETQSARPAAGLGSALAMSPPQHAPPASAAVTAAPSTDAPPPGRDGGRRRAEASLIDPSLLCPITQVGRMLCLSDAVLSTCSVPAYWSRG